METIDTHFKKRTSILALGAESEGVFCAYKNGKIYVSENYGDLLDSANFSKYKRADLAYLAKEKIKPSVVITDLHPLYNSTVFGEELAKKFGAEHIKVQHHIAHIFSAIGDHLLLQSATHNLPTNFIGIAADGTGYGLDENIWGGEVFRLQMVRQLADKSQRVKIERIGSLEEQTMICGELAVKEPARMLIGILSRFLAKKEIYPYTKDHYTKNEFEALHSQLEQNFNCQKTTSTGRVLDAASVLLGFAKNERKYKHEATKLLEKNSTIPYEIESRITNHESRKIINTTYLFEYLIKNRNKDRKRLAATAQLYIAKGLYELAKPYANSHTPLAIFAGGGMANNRIISGFLQNKGVYISKKIPRGDQGISFGQLIYRLLN